ncbi:DUF4365 domain-containing protein [Sphingomonas parapaucimobilis]|uniref:DUF4365 domain-containing protein n=1 Tax=Sphingomonas parapaucimobilis TaxID=28213 RepID=UPI00391D1845
MSITVQHIQEDLSRAHIQAVAAIAGVNLVTNYAHDYGIDGEFKHILIGPKGNRAPTGFGIEFQAKASIKWFVRNNQIIYDLDVKNYNDIVNRHEAAPTVMLILLCLPRDQDEWHQVDYSITNLKNCCYYHMLSGPPVTGKTKRVYIPQEQVLTPAAVHDLLFLERARLTEGYN